MATTDKFDWSNDVIIEFIQHYEAHPVLWDPKHKNHKNRNSLHNAWEEIAADISVEVTVDALKRKKESLMSTYRTLIKKVRDSESNGSGAKDIYEPTWFAFHSIDSFIHAARKIPSLCSEETHNYNEQFSQDAPSQSELRTPEVLHKAEPIIKEEIVDDSLQEIIQDSEFVKLQGAPKKRARGGVNEPELNIAKHLRNESDILSSIATKSETRHTETQQDAPALYGQLLAAKFRTLPKRTYLVLQNQIDNLLFQAEFNEIDSATVICSNCSNITKLNNI